MAETLWSHGAHGAIPPEGSHILTYDMGTHLEDMSVCM